MVVDPGALVACLLNHPLVECLPEHVSLTAGQEPGVWDVCNQRGERLESSNRVVIAAAAQSLSLLPDELLAQHPMPRLAAMQRLAGQVTYLPAKQALTRGEVTLSGQGYILPVDPQGQVIGSTYERFGESAQVSRQGHQQNIEKVSAMLANPVGKVDTPEQGWAGWRCALSDHLPVMGFVPGQPGLFMAAAYGSRGLSWSLLAASLFAAYCLEEPIPLERRLEQALIPR
jgi:tRNA 5-methylaminomethyl-2-thiouridine biosynthesis bifunctional protein